MPTILVDSSFLVAIAYNRSPQHQIAVAFGAQRSRDLLIPEGVLVEAMFNINRLGGTRAAVGYGRLLRSQGLPFVHLTLEDLGRVFAVMEQYADADLDFVDCCITALAERLNITQIATFDRRDFSMIRPKHTAYFELLP